MQINILDYLENAAAQYPDKTAFSDESCSFTFAQLMAKAKAIGSTIAYRTQVIRRPVAVFIDRTAVSIAGFLGVVYSGNFYVPIDVHMPQARILQILNQMDPAALIYSTKHQSLVHSVLTAQSAESSQPAQPTQPAQPAQLAHSAHSVHPDQASQTNESSQSVQSDQINDSGKLPCICMEDILSDAINEQVLQQIRSKILDIDPLYVLFTSGSTGVPKGIVVSHRGVIDLTEWLAETFHFSDKDIIGNQTPFFFDASVKDIYLTLRCGATMHILPKKLFLFPLKLLEALREHRVTAILWAVSAMTLVANSGALDKVVPDTINKAFFAGEAMSAKVLNHWRRHLPNVRYTNLYGPTEITVDCSYYTVDRDFADDEPIPIGHACRNMELLLLDENGQPVPDGDTGEICVRGIGVALGYYNDRDKSDAVFVQNPLNPHYRDLIYRTGDIARKNEHGELVFSSRRDGQIKHMGYRIELGEVETAVSALEQVQAAICIFDSEADKIVLFYQGADADDRTILQGLGDKLPKYMLPNRFIKRDEMPYNENGKIDRVRLREQYFHEQNNR